jgi:3-isopropylmalate/(R)-2-methylmalate dehydratase small subunit
MAKAWTFENNLNTDEIIPARYNLTIDEKELAKNVFCEIKPAFPTQVKPGDIVVAGFNFGCGSSREHAPIAIKGSGVKCVIAASYARIFFRNAINIGLPILECARAAERIREGHDVEVDLASGRIFNRTLSEEYQATPLPEFVLQIIAAGGMVAFLKNHDIEELVQ